MQNKNSDSCMMLLGLVLATKPNLAAIRNKALQYWVAKHKPIGYEKPEDAFTYWDINEQSDHFILDNEDVID